MNREELKAKALECMEAGDTMYSIEQQRNCILAAQVFATLATIPDPEEPFYKPHTLEP